MSVEYEVITFDDDLPNCAYDGKFYKVDSKLIKYITNRVRKTIEYKNLIHYLKRTMNINRCSFYKDYSIDRGFTIELHHAPLCLYDYVEVLCNKYFSENGFVKCWEIEEHANKLHYQFMVGLVPLNVTAHKLVHSNALSIHPEMVNFKWDLFVSEFDKFLTDEIRSKIELFKEMSKKNINEFPDIVKYKPLIINNVKFKSLGNINIAEMIVEKLRSRLELTNTVNN